MYFLPTDISVGIFLFRFRIKKTKKNKKKIKKIKKSIDKYIFFCYNYSKEGKENPKHQKGFKTMTDYRTCAASLYDGGWRAEDRDDLIEEYKLTEEEASNLCEILTEFELEND